VVLRPLPAGGRVDRLEGMPDHPHLLVPEIVTDERGRTLLLSRAPQYGSLDALLAKRAGLLAGEIAALGLALARALATMHAADRAHGAVVAAAVGIGAEARPQLDPAAVVVDRGATPADDVAALGELLAAAAADPVPLPLRAVLSAARDPDPALRPTAADLARQLAASADPEPLRLTGLPGSALRSAPGRARASSPGAWRRPRNPAPWWRPVAMGAASIVALAAAVVLGALWAGWADAERVTGGPGPQQRPQPATAVPSRGAASTSASPTDWGAVVARLDRARADAFTSADPASLVRADARGSPAWLADVAAVRELLGAAAHADSYVARVHAVVPVSVGPGRAVLEVDDSLAGYRIVASDGETLAARPARGSRRWRVVLVRDGTSKDWLVERVTAL
jgi:hypothetical protein